MSSSVMDRKQEEAARAEARVGAHLTSPLVENIVIAPLFMGREARATAGELLCLHPPDKNRNAALPE